jgi:hypothetical protein
MRWIALWVFMMLPGTEIPAAELAFQPGNNGGFTFDTGVLTGLLRPQGKSLGMVAVVHKPTGLPVSRGDYGICSLYRVFTNNYRFGRGAWDWPSVASVVDGGVRVQWTAETNRPFVLEVFYRWTDPQSLRVEVSVRATQDLPGFEVFLASYFNEAFSKAAVLVPAPSGVGNVYAPAEEKEGLWQMFPRDKQVTALIQDGRWKLPPNPVEWVVRTPFADPKAVRWVDSNGLAAMFTAKAEDCFAISMPFQTERHYSIYLSLFGRDIKSGARESAAVKFTVQPHFEAKSVR